MSRSERTLADALRALEADELDLLTPGEVAQLGRALNEDVRLAARVAQHVPRPSREVAAALRAVEDAAVPSAEAWERAWERIDTSRAGVTLAGGGRRWAIRHWRPFAAAAACVLVSLTWVGWRASRPVPWPVQLASEIEILDLEVGDGAVPFVFTVEGEQEAEFIWVLELEDGREL